MDYGKLTALRRSHPAWRLLLASHAPLVASFLHEAFIAPNVLLRQIVEGTTLDSGARLAELSETP